MSDTGTDIQRLSDRVAELETELTKTRSELAQILIGVMTASVALMAYADRDISEADRLWKEATASFDKAMAGLADSLVGTGNDGHE